MGNIGMNDEERALCPICENKKIKSVALFKRNNILFEIQSLGRLPLRRTPQQHFYLI
jgi:hypothetical protein